jgi:hypothetical protein
MEHFEKYKINRTMFNNILHTLLADTNDCMGSIVHIATIAYGIYLLSYPLLS